MFSFTPTDKYYSCSKHNYTGINNPCPDCINETNTSKILHTCCKCGNQDIYIAYREKGEQLDQTIGGMKFGIAQKDCLYMYCRTCSYRWTEKTYDEIVNRWNK